MQVTKKFIKVLARLLFKVVVILPCSYICIHLGECSGSVSRALDWESKGC